MRLSNALAVMVFGAALAVPVRAPAQVSISVMLGRRLGPEINIFAYSQPAYGDWRTQYRQWTPVTVYEYDGHYYHHSVRGSRAVMVYRRNDEYFLPPREKAWVGVDRRYNYKRQPDGKDRERAKPRDDNQGNGNGNGRGRGRGRGHGGL